MAQDFFQRKRGVVQSAPFFKKGRMTTQQVIAQPPGGGYGFGPIGGGVGTGAGVHEGENGIGVGFDPGAIPGGLVGTPGSGGSKPDKPGPTKPSPAPSPAPKPGPGGGGSGSKPSQTGNVDKTLPGRTAVDRSMMSQADWQRQYGNINFDAGAIKGIFDTATRDEYAAKSREYSNTEKAYYDQLGTTQNSLLQAQRQAAAQNAVQTGANRGMQNAATLTSLLSQSAAGAPGALTLAQGRRALIDQEQAAYSANTKEADALAEQRKLDYAKVGSELYATDAQKYVGELGYDAAALEQAITKYGIDRSKGGGYQDLFSAAMASGDWDVARQAYQAMQPPTTTTPPPSWKQRPIQRPGKQPPTLDDLKRGQHRTF